MNFGVLHLSQPKAAIAEARRVLAGGGRFAFTAWVQEGNAEAEIVDAAVDAHAVAVDLPVGPPYYRFADVDEARGALAEGGFDIHSFREETITVLWRVPSAELLFEAEIAASVRTGTVIRAQPPERLEAIRRTSRKRSGATPTAMGSRCRSSRAFMSARKSAQES